MIRTGWMRWSRTPLARTRPAEGIDDVEYGTLEWVDWFNQRRLLGPIGHVPPAEFEAAYHRKEGSREGVGLNVSMCAVAAGVVLAWDVGVNWSAARGSAEKITSWAFWGPTLINASQTGAALVPGLADELAAAQGVATASQLYAAQVVAGSPAVVLGACKDIEAYGCRPTS
jgi:hypothetical protein